MKLVGYETDGKIEILIRADIQKDNMYELRSMKKLVTVNKTAVIKFV